MFMSSVLLAEVLRGSEVESRHFGVFVVADAARRVVLSGGDAERAIFPRSAVKALQALPLLLSGAADRFGLSDAELALACASHIGTPQHARVAADMLARAGRDETCLECGAHWPASPEAARSLAAACKQPGALHNNCSGKHAGFVCTAIHTGHDPLGYVGAEHPVMRAVTAAMSAVTGEDLARQTPAIDGCSIPTYAIPLRNLAAGFARFGTGTGMPDGFAEAARRLRQAVADHPVMLAGAGRFDTVVTQALGAAAFIKLGAEGVYCGALPMLGLGFALKCDDGTPRAAEAATAALLQRLLGPNEVLYGLANPNLTNWNGLAVGQIRSQLP
jgi:L-asparaginase II